MPPGQSTINSILESILNDEPPQRTGINTTSAIAESADSESGTMGVPVSKQDLSDEPEQSLQKSMVPYDNGEWVSVCSQDSEDEWYCTPRVEDCMADLTLHCAPRASVGSQSGDATRMRWLEENLIDAQLREQQHTSLINAQKVHISVLNSSLADEQCLSIRLGESLSTLFVLMTQSQQHELDKVQRRLLDLQTDAETYVLAHEWRVFQEKLQSLNSTLDGHMKRSMPNSIPSASMAAGYTVVLGNLLRDVPHIKEGLKKLEHDIAEEKARVTEDNPSGSSTTPKRIALESLSLDHFAMTDVIPDTSADILSVTDILDRYYEFTRLHRKRIVTRQEKLQTLLDEFLIEIGRLQADLDYEEARATNMLIRLEFWMMDLEAPRINSLDELFNNLESKRQALQRGYMELERIAEIMKEVPSHFNMIDIHGPREAQASAKLEGSGLEASEGSVSQDGTSAADQHGDASYITELQAKLNHLVFSLDLSLDRFDLVRVRQKEKTAALNEQLDSLKSGKEELEKGVKKVADKLFQHRERLWGLSPPARKMGEELISILAEQLNINCDGPQVYE
ncbi:hypothetical protein F4777DRAFT_538843 [Nemania sp. FL0916]|nr:hypothetical protein F4777DRAFT_538843 [Nemania sp. FL0916]